MFGHQSPYVQLYKQHNSIYLCCIQQAKKQLTPLFSKGNYSIQTFIR